MDNTSTLHSKYYIAFSIHGTNCFIVATKLQHEIKDIKALNMSEVKSRRSFAKINTDVKLNYEKLNNVNGKPTASKTKVLKIFKELENDGWEIIGRKEFIKKHY